MDSAGEGVVQQTAEGTVVVCCNCKKNFPLENATVKRWRPDGSVAQAVCRPCGGVASMLARKKKTKSLRLLSNEERVDFFNRAREDGVDAKALLDEMVVTTESQEFSSGDGRKGKYHLVDSLKERSPYKSNPAALETLLERSYTLEGIDGLKRVWVPEYERTEVESHGRKTTKETTFSQRTTAPKANPKAKPKAKPKADVADQAMEKYSKTLQALLKKTQKDLEKTSADLSTVVFVLSSEEARDFTSKHVLEVGNQCVRDLVAYLTSIRDGVNNQEEAGALEKKAADCQETLKDSKKSLKKLQGHLGIKCSAKSVDCRALRWWCLWWPRLWRYGGNVGQGGGSGGGCGGRRQWYSGSQSCGSMVEVMWWWMCGRS